MKLPFLSSKSTTPPLPEQAATTSWPWTSCGTISKTHSFRAPGDMPTSAEEPVDSGGGCSDDGDKSVEAVIRGLRTSAEERLFFEPGESSSILEDAGKSGAISVVMMEMESCDPHGDFRRSMEEMVEAHGVKEWEELEELLSWYLRVNGKSNHGYIVGAFVDLLVSSNTLASSSSCSSSSSTSITVSATGHSPVSPLSSSSSTTSSSSSISPCLSSLMEAEDEIEKKTAG